MNVEQIRQELDQLSENAALSAMQTETRLQLEQEVFRAVTTSPYPRMELAKIARWNQVGVEHIEQVAHRVLKQRTGQDLEMVEYSQICKAVEHLEKTIADPGLREWKLTRLAKRFNSTARQIMEAYNKTLCQQAITKPLSIKEFREQNGQEVDWLVPGWIPKGTTLLLHADGGVGKTLFAYQLMQSLVQGTSWNGYRVEQSPVLLVQVDEPALVTAERIDIRGFQDSDRLHIFSSWSVNQMTELEAYIDEIGAEFIVIDSLTAINTSSMFSENDTEYARPLLQLANIASRKKKTFFVIHHSNADGNSRGSRAIHNSVSEVWGLTYGEGTERVLRVQKTRMGRPPGRYKFAFQEDDYSFSYIGEENESGDNSTQEAKVKLWLADSEQIGKAYAPIEVSELLGMGKEATRRALRELWSKGLIRRKRNSCSSGYLYYAPNHLDNFVGERSGDQNPIAVRSPVPIAPKVMGSITPSESDRAIAPNFISDSAPKIEKSPIARSLSPKVMGSITLKAIGDSDRTAIGGDQNAIASPLEPESETELHNSTSSGENPRDPVFRPGDKVEIRRDGVFYGKPVFVKHLGRRGKVVVKGKDWAIAQNFNPCELKLIERSGGGHEF
jgi:KaiC/GvpD/RAD55 family RecA-like ATPase